MSHRSRCFLVAVLTALMSGCGGLTESREAPRREYWLVPEAADGLPKESLPIAPIVLEVSAAPGMDRAELLQLDTTGLLREYAGARWTDTATGVLRLYLRLALEQAQPAARSDAVGGGEQILLRVDLRELYVLAAGNRESARLAARVSYSCGGAEGSWQIRETEPVTEARLAAVVAAHRRNFTAFSEQLIDLIASSCASGA